MNVTLPTASELEKLPMRAVVAYVGRTARRVAAELHGVVTADALNNALKLIDGVATTETIGAQDAVAVITAAGHVVEAYEAAPHEAKSLRKFYLVFTFVYAGLAAMHTIEAALDPERSRDEMQQVIRAVGRALRPVQALDTLTAQSVAEAARDDYDRLLMAFGKHDDVVIGEPVTCFVYETK